MPYSVPGVATPPPPAPLPMHSAGRPGHRRSYTFALDDPTHVGAFASLGALPRRAKPAPYSAPPTPPAAKRAGVFHFRNDEEDDSSPDDDDKHPSNNDDDNDGPPPPLRLRQPPPSPLRLTPPTGAIPFPRASPTGMSTPQLPPPQRPPGPQRTSSHPVILLSNGKPLKSSLKSSSSAPNVHGRNNNNNHHGQQPPFHLRARSAPSTPQFQVGDAEEDEDTAPLSPTTPKNVHFPAASDQLATVLLFRRSARPASVLSLPGDDAETETETEASDRDMRWRGAVGSWAGGSKRDGHHAHGRPGSPGYPFPPTPLAGSSFASPLGPRRHSHHGHHHHPHSQKGSSEGKEGEWHYALDAPGVPRAAGKEDMVLLEGFVLSAEGAHPCFSSSTDSATASSGEGEADPQMHLHGTLLARNCAFEKKVFVRFTLDGWDTTSEVGGRYVESLGADAGVDAVSAAAAGAGGVSAREAGEEGPGPGWDRFAFSIRLTDYAGRGSATGSTSTASTTTSSSASNSQASGLQSEGRAPRTRKQLPPGSTTGLAPHLARRALVLVARFCVPWVERGGVAPYVWGDELVASSPPASSSSSSPDSAATKPPRVWTGTGGGCAGEWWDNNSGRDYKIGFRVVPGLGGDSSSESESSSSSEGEKGAVAVGGEGGAPKPNGESEDTAAEGIPFPTSTGDASEEGAAPLIHGKPHVPVPRPHLRSLPSLAVARAAGALSPASPAGQQQHAGSPHGDDGAHAHAHSNGAHTHAPIPTAHTRPHPPRAPRAPRPHPRRTRPHPRTRPAARAPDPATAAAAHGAGAGARGEAGKAESEELCGAGGEGGCGCSCCCFVVDPDPTCVEPTCGVAVDPTCDGCSCYSRGEHAGREGAGAGAA
ncbi:hypothetical protein C8J57DRAFT_2118 [Mycena rebaudengoi]|nr:hypothetical protein C8J57DRAFT_2118 [Mycena rebaudengoi]